MNKAVGDGMSDVDAAVLVVEASPKFQSKTVFRLPKMSLLKNCTAEKFTRVL